MIIIKLQGGLGNQIFQYCFGRSLSHKTNHELMIDISYFNHDRPHHAIYGLHGFNIKGVVGNYPLITTNPYFDALSNLLFFKKNKILFKNSKLIDFLLNNFERKKSNPITSYLKEPHNTALGPKNTWNPNMFESIKLNTYFEGYFQYEMDSKYRLFISEYFFNEYNKLIHDDLKYLLNLTKESEKIANDMENTNSVLLHVRHGDYTGLLDFGLCSEEYYENAIKTIASKVENPKFFIFSDDIEGAKKLKINYPHVFVDFKENNELVGRGNGELLKLMSSCKHFIIANSSLSWWAAFLSENEDKIIISPTPWFQSRRIMGAKKIDNKETILVINNNKELFEENNTILHSIKNINEFKFKNLKYEINNENIKIKNIHENSSMILKSKNKSVKRIIIKISIQSNHFNCLEVYFKTKNNKKYTKGNVFRVYYYENDEFEHYLLLPSDAILDDLKIKPGNPTDDEDYLIIKSLEIKEIDK